MDFINSSAQSFGDMVKTMTARSETSVQTYRRDLEEFGAVAEESLESLGQAVDDLGNLVWRCAIGLKKALFHGQGDALCGIQRRPRASFDLRREVGDGVEVEGGNGMGGPVEDGLEERRRSASSGDSDFTVVSSVRSVLDADEVGWDEIEDCGSSGWKKVGSCGSFDRIELRKRLFMAEDDEDLSWDVEDDVPGEAMAR